MKKVCYSLCWLAVSLACSSQETNSTDAPTVVVDLKNGNIEKELPAFTRFSTVELETTDESLLPDVAKVVCHGNRIYVLPMMKPTVFIFDRSGKFLTKLSQGQGPGEVMFVSDMTVFHDTLYVMDVYRSLKAYDLEGTFICEKAKFESPYFSVAFTPKGVYLSDPNINKQSDHNLHFFGLNGEKRQFLPKNQFLREISLLCYDFMRNGYIVWPFSNIVYREHKDSTDLIPACRIDFKGAWVDEQIYREAVTNKTAYSGGLDNYARWLKDFMPLKGGGFYFSFRYDTEYFVKYDHGEVSIYSTLLSGFPHLNTGAVGAEEHTLIYSYTPQSISAYQKEHPAPQTKELERLYEWAKDETKNPILCFIPVE